jgi:hypothetical protein
LRGLEGILIEIKGNHRLVVSVTLLQRSVAVSLDSVLVSSLRPLKAPLYESANLRSRLILDVA